MSEGAKSFRRPIDVVYLIHKALRALAARAEKEVEQLEALGGLHSFNLLFNSWATILLRQTDLKRQHIRGAQVSGRPSGPAQGTQTSYAIPHADLPDTDKPVTAPLEDLVVAPLNSLDDELLGSVQAVLTVLNEEIGKTSVITRTKQHVQRSVLALRIVQEDQLETEEALVLPAIRDGVSERQQLQMARSLLIDEGADDPRWLIDWLASECDPTERRQLEQLEERFTRLTD